MNIMMKYKQIIFDVDGTLADTEYAVLHSLQDTVKTITGGEMPLEELTFALGITGKDALIQLEFPDVPAALALWIDNLHEYDDTVSIFPGIETALKALSQAGCRFGIVTSRIRDDFEQEFRRFSIRRYFDIIVCADDTKEHKPTAAPLLKYMELSGAKCDEILYVGDSRYDRECARSAGVDFALAGWGSRLKEIDAEYHLTAPEDLIRVQNAG